ncbi:MAG: LLM class F420-dependent oxidoreductase [Candidatus Thorarchaeota archaeon SMTZ1-83]|nr:MAG: hypothetical protein AM324_00875 [Candidatus Thorarchaeota archaeon SMTZ1-83]
MQPGFGVHIAPQFGYSYEEVQEIVAHVERKGYNLLTIGDHLFLDENSAERDCMEAWMLVGALASQTSRIRLGTLVSANSFRHPSLMAKMAATADVISNGRLVFGIGAGWKEIEYDAYGYDFPTARVRLEQLEEAVQIIRLMWTEDAASFEGHHYRIRNAFCSPKPIQKPHPPILVGGHGKKHTLRIVAKYADMCNITFQVGFELVDLLDALRLHCEKAGRDYDSIEKTFFVYCAVFEEEQDLELFIENLAMQQGTTSKRLKERHSQMPGSWIGTPESIIEKCRYLQERGFTLFQVRFPFGQDIHMSSLFHERVASRI